MIGASTPTLNVPNGPRSQVSIRMVMLFLFSAAVMGAVVAIAADAIRFGSLGAARTGPVVTLVGLVLSYAFALVVVFGDPFIEDNGSLQRLPGTALFLLATEFAGWFAPVVVPACLGLWSCTRTRLERRRARPDMPVAGRTGKVG